jgi:hypothetical protein
MKSRTKPALRALSAAQVQISLPVQGVLRDVRHALLGLCIDDGQKVLAALMESDRIALCGPKGVPDAGRRALRGQPGCAGRPAHCGASTTGAFVERWRAGLAELRVGRQRRPARCRDDGRHRCGRIHPPLRQHPGAGASGAPAARRIQERCVAPLRTTQPGAACAVAGAPAGRTGSACCDDRRHPLPGAGDPAGHRHRYPGQQARVGTRSRSWPPRSRIASTRSYAECSTTAATPSSSR